MFKKIIKIIILLTSTSMLPNTYALADVNLNYHAGNTGQIIEQAAAGVSNAVFSVAKGQAYDEANDPAFRSLNGGPAEESPQHGYFAVPLLVIGLAGILLFFIRDD